MATAGHLRGAGARDGPGVGSGGRRRGRSRNRHSARVGVGGEVGLHGIDQPCALAQGKAEAGVHGGSAEEVGEEEEPDVAGVGEGVGSCAQHDVSLVGVAMDDMRDGLSPRPP